MGTTYARKEGTIRLIHTDAHDVVLGVLLEKHTSIFPGDVASATGVITNHNDAQKLPKLVKKPKEQIGGQILKRDEKMVLQFNSDSAPGTHLEGTKSLVRLPITLQNLRSGFVYETMLNAAGCGFTSDTLDAIKDQFITLGTLTIGAQEATKLGIVPVDIRVDGAYSFIIVEQTTV